MTDFEEMVLKYLADIVDMMRGNMYTRVEETIQKPVVLTEQPKAKYTWYKLRDGGKVRKCNNEPCPYYLKWNDEKKTWTSLPHQTPQAEKNSSLIFGDNLNCH